MVQRYKVNRETYEDADKEFDTGGGRTWLKLEDGTNYVRVLPPWSEEGRFYWTVGQHDSGFQTDRVTCPNVTFKEDGCPICARIIKAKQQFGDKAARLFQPKKRAIMNALYLGIYDERRREVKWASAEDQSIVRIWEAAPSIIQPIVNELSENDDDDLLDPEKGHSIKVRKYDKNGKTNYDTLFDTKPSSLSVKFQLDVDQILGNLHNLAEATKRPTKDDLLDVLDQILSKAERGDDDRDEGRRGRSSGGGRGRDTDRRSAREFDDEPPAPTEREEPRARRDDKDNRDDRRPPPAREEPRRAEPRAEASRRADPPPRRDDRDDRDDRRPAARDDRDDRRPPARDDRRPPARDDDRRAASTDRDDRRPAARSRDEEEIDRLAGEDPEPGFDDPKLDEIPFD